MNYNDYKYERVWVNKDNDLLARLYNTKENQSQIFNIGKGYIPSMFIEDENGNYFSFTNGARLKEVKFQDGGRLYNFIKSTPQAYGYNNRPHKFIREEFPNTLDSNHEFHELFLDIETRSEFGFPKPNLAQEEVTMIQLYDTKLKKYIILGRKEFTGTFEQEQVEYLCIPDEKKLLNTFMSILEKLNPTAIKTFNGLLFDFPYLTNRIKLLGLDYNRLSPVRDVKIIDEIITQDGMTGMGVSWEGLYLVDLRELFLKYAYAGLANNGLGNVSNFYGFEGKIDHSEFDSFDGQYTGKGYLFPSKVPPEDSLDYEIYLAQVAYRDEPSNENLINMQQVCFNKFVIYSVKDVELMVKIEEKAKLFEKSKGIAYICGVNMDECMGTLKQWKAFVYNECIKNNVVLPLTQQYGETNCVYKAGWTTSKPGKYNWVASFDFTSLYPSLFQAFNIGTDTMIKPEELEEMPDLKHIKNKYFYFFTEDYIRNHPEENENDTIGETEFYQFLMDNKDEITPVLKKYNVTATPNGQFFRRDVESVSSVLMRRIFHERVAYKRESQKLYADLEEIKGEMAKRGLEV
jgi:DNA polymerase elongation subunit (family B)